ncbi:NAD(P)-dependent dehydrogenase (short-subunit alcohol dehydrogenase family) [Paraburkholderia phenoliruptrix]|nr:NAD(P)-dependent dehydrogenase (short-subunit alcohol dehydrogenase family) [Paraburkholderia phenoliruptrix]
MTPLASISAALWRRITTVNVDAPFLLAQAFSVGMTSGVGDASPTLHRAPYGDRRPACPPML